MTGSPAEREIRVAVVARIRRDLPRARVVHELVCGSSRADLAAVEPDRVVLFEIKSERDTLDRLENQMKAFIAASHVTVLVAHDCWFDRSRYNDGSERVVWPHPFRGSEIWCYPEQAPTNIGSGYRWNLPRPTLRQPAARKLLGLLWRQELIAECNRHRISTARRPTMDVMIDDMAWLMTGQEIVKAVCRQLRTRPFPEADAPIVEDAPKPTAAPAREHAL